MAFGGVMTAIRPKSQNNSIVYFLYDDFTTEEEAPLTTPRTCEPGPGTLTIRDTNSVISIADGALVINGTPADNDGFTTGSAQTRAAGIALLLDVPANVSSMGVVGWSDDALPSSGLSHGYGIESGELRAFLDGGGRASEGAAPAALSLAMIMHGTGGLALYRGSLSGAYTLSWVYNTNTGNQLGKYRVWNGAFDTVVGTFRVVNLGTYDARFATDNGLATSVTASPILNTTGTHTADALIELSGLVPSADSTQLLYRSDSDVDGFRVDINTDGNVYLQELVDADPDTVTQRGSAAHGVADGAAYRVVIVPVGNVHKIYVNNALKITYTDAGNHNNTATAAKVLAVGTGDTLANLVCWPRSVTLPSGI